MKSHEKIPLRIRRSHPTRCRDTVLNSPLVGESLRFSLHGERVQMQCV